MWAKNTPQNQGVGLFAGNNQQQAQQPQTGGGGIFGNPQPASNTGGGGIFGGNAQQNNNNKSLFGAGGGGGGVFGTNPSPTTGSILSTAANGAFGGTAQQPQNQPQGGTLFGGGQNTQGAFGMGATQNTGGILGGNQPQTQGGVFGATQPQTNTGGGIFGGGTTPNTNGTTGFFGGANTATTGQNAWGAQQQPQQQTGGGIFGGTTPQQNTQNTGVFGGTTQPQTNTGGGMFNSFAPTQQQPQQPQQPQQQGIFGQAAQNTNTGNSWLGGNTQNQANNNKWNTNAPVTSANTLGGTSWGVPTQFNANQNQNQNLQPKPVKSKNTKLDAKHLVKCITALDEFTGICKEELRAKYVISDGQFPCSMSQLGQNAGNKGMIGQNQFNSPSTFNNPTSNLGWGNPQTTQNPQTTGQAPFFGTNPAQQTQPTATTNSIFGGTNQPQQAAKPFGFGTQPTSNSFTPLGGASTLTGGTANQSTFNLGSQNKLGGLGAPLGQTTPSFGNTNPSQPFPGFGSSPTTNQGIFGQTPQQATTIGNTSFPTNPQANTFAPQNQQSPLFGGTAAPQTLGGMSLPTMGMPQQNLPYQQPNSQFPQMTSGTMGNPLGTLSGNTNFHTVSPILSNGLYLNQSPAGETNQEGMDVLTKMLKSMVSNGMLTKEFLSSIVEPTPFDKMIEKNKNMLQKEQEESYRETAFKEVNSPFNDHDFYDPEIREDPKSRKRDAFFPPQNLKVTYVSDDRPRKPLMEDFELKKVGQALQETKKSVRSINRAVESQLPVTMGFNIRPNLSQLKNHSGQALKHIDDITIENRYGSIHFLDEINLYGKVLADCVKISQDVIEILDPEWEQVSAELTFNNFAEYAQADQATRKKIEKKMQKWCIKMNMKVLNFNKDNGNLTVLLE